MTGTGSEAAIGLRRQRRAAIPAARPKTAIPLPAQSQPFAPVPATLRNARLDHWEACAPGLRVQDVDPDALHRDPFMPGGNRGQQADDLDIIALT